MMDERMAGALNKQINEELYSSYLYLAMASYFEDLGLKGFASWMKVQVQEEVAHAMKIFNFLGDRGEKVKLLEIKKPDDNWENPLKAFEAALYHERFITGCINELLNLSTELKDHSTSSFLNWYVDEQVEEEATASDVVSKLKFAGNNGNSLLMLDKEMGTRVFVNPLAKDGAE